MSDARLRDLERSWKETGSVEDEAAYLLERVRVGELKETQVELAAYLGHGAASAVVAVQQPRTLGALVTGLNRWSSEELMRRIGVALLRLTDWQRVERVRQTVELLEADVECRCSPHWGELAALPNPRYPDDDRDRATARAARYAVLSALYPENAQETLREVVRSLVAVDRSADPIQGLRADLVPWSLGYSDPVRQRVEARRGSST